MSKFVPAWYLKDLKKLDLMKLKENNIKVVLFDLDNTIIGAYENELSPDIFEILVNVTKMFKVYIISNNHPPRVEKIAKSLNCGFLANTRKPTTKRLKKFLLDINALNSSTVLIGDQLLTDIWCANQLGIKSILVEPLEKSDLLITRFNRILDKRMRKFMIKNNRFKEL
jgi:hypothetical protein